MADSLFSNADIRKLIAAFPPPDPRPGKSSLLRSLSGNDLVRSDAVTKRFTALLDSSPRPVLLSSLPRELGVQEVQWLLEQEQSQVFFSRDRQRLLSKQIQTPIITKLRETLDNGAIDLTTFATLNDITTETLRRMVAQCSGINLITTEDGAIFSDDYLAKTRARLQETLRNASKSAINLSELFSQLSALQLEKMSKDITSDKSSSVEGLLERDSRGVRFTPHSALQQLQTDLESARAAYIDEAVVALNTVGYCSLAIDRQPEIMRKDVNQDPSDLSNGIKSAFAKDSPEEILNLDFILVRGGVLTSSIAELGIKAEGIAAVLWNRRVPGDDVFAGANLLELLTNGSDKSDLHAAILRHHEDQAMRPFEQRLAQLQESTIQQFNETVQSQLLCLYRLYTQGLESIVDNTLQFRVTEFVRDWARRELVPEVLTNIKQKKLVANKSALRDVDKFSEAVQAARSLDEISAAVAKLARKQKIDQPDNAALTRAKNANLAQKVAAMRKMKRGSSLLQNLTWILLATTRDGLYMSAGKDTSRVIKLYQSSDGDAETAKKLGELRDIVKEDKDTDTEREEMRAIAQAVIAGGADIK